MAANYRKPSPSCWKKEIADSRSPLSVYQKRRAHRSCREYTLPPHIAPGCSLGQRILGALMCRFDLKLKHHQFSVMKLKAGIFFFFWSSMALSYRKGFLNSYILDNTTDNLRLNVFMLGSRHLALFLILPSFFICSPMLCQ